MKRTWNLPALTLVGWLAIGTSRGTVIDAGRQIAAWDRSSVSRALARAGRATPP